MRALNQKGQVVVFFILVVPLLLLCLVTTVEFSKTVFYKMKLQGALDQGVYAGASYLTEVLNQIADRNWKAAQLFRDLKKDFLVSGSKKSEKEAKEQIQNMMVKQNALREEMVSLANSATERAYRIVSQVVGQYFPEALVTPLYHSPLLLGEGPKESFSFDKIQGPLFDPTGHQKISKQEYEVRMAFVKDPHNVVALAAGVETKKHLKAVSAAQPFGGSIWNFSFSPKRREEFLYQTSMVPLKRLPPKGYLPLRENSWRGFNPYDVHH